jgi:metallo-beta-lactamase class B
MPFLLLFSFLLAQNDFSKQIAGWNRPAAPHRIAGNLYFVGTAELGMYLITTPDGHVLIDGGLDVSVPLIKKSIHQLGFRYEEIKVLLNTHAHADHAGGLAQIKKETGARLMATAADAALLEAGGRGDFLLGDAFLFPPVKVDRILADGDEVRLGGVTLVARHTPGHTQGATTWMTTIKEGERAYRVVVAPSTSVNPGTSLVNNAKYPEIVEDWQRTYKVTKMLHPDIFLAPHPQFFDMARKAKGGPGAYVDPEGYRRYIERGEQQFKKLLAEQRKAPPSR